MSEYLNSWFARKKVYDMKGIKHWLILLALASVPMSSCSACVTVDIGAQTTQTLQKLEQDLLTQSTAWQTTIQNAIDQIDRTETQVISDLKSVLSHAIEAAGATGACLFDKVHSSLSTDVAAILAIFTHKPVPEPQPNICTSSEVGIDLSPGKIRPNEIDYLGYDFHFNELQAVIKTKTGSQPLYLTHPSTYTLTINLTQSGTYLLDPATDISVQILWKGEILSEVPILYLIPSCQPMPGSYYQPEYDLVPTEHIRGDNDFANDPTSITIWTQSSYDSQHIWFVVNAITLQETGGDNTTYQAFNVTIVFNYQPPYGYKILNVLGGNTTSSAHMTRQSGDEITNQPADSGYVQYYFTAFYDWSAHSGGSTAGVRLHFNTLMITLIQDPAVVSCA